MTHRLREIDPRSAGASSQRGVPHPKLVFQQRTSQRNQLPTVMSAARSSMNYLLKLQLSTSVWQQGVQERVRWNLE